MLRTKRVNEGYLLVDHRESPGLTPEELLRSRQSPLMPVGKGRKFETHTFTCSHCDRIVVMNPLRSRARGYCPKCDHYVCDKCEVDRVLTNDCRCREKRIAEFLEKALKQPVVYST